MAIVKATSPSRTARSAAAHRAVHQTLEGGSVFADPYAWAVLGEDAGEVLAQAAAEPSRRRLRLFMAARSRFAEDALAAAVSRGVRQAVILGAGLDTFSLRNPHATAGLRVFEVDHPATQQWKRERLAQAGLTLPQSATFAPVDFERQSLAEGLDAAGFRSDRAAFFHWLGVVPYLTRDAISATLDFIARVPASEMVFDYPEPLENYPPERRANVAAIAQRAASVGEPWVSYFDPAVLAKELSGRGFDDLEDLDFTALAERLLAASKGGIKSGSGSHVVRARRSAANAGVASARS
jgi:methyltransferase (TIGR00027 family)